MPDKHRDYTINSIFARALNNTGEYQQALDTMEIIREQGETDPLWHYRRGFSLGALDRYIEAEAALYRAKSLANESDPVINWADELLEEIKENQNPKV